MSLCLSRVEPRLGVRLSLGRCWGSGRVAYGNVGTHGECECTHMCERMHTHAGEGIRSYEGLWRYVCEFGLKVEIRSLGRVCAACMYVLEGTYLKRWGCRAARLA